MMVITKKEKYGVIPLDGWRQEDQKFKTSLTYTRPYHEEEEKNEKEGEKRGKRKWEKVGSRERKQIKRSCLSKAFPRIICQTSLIHIENYSRSVELHPIIII